MPSTPQMPINTENLVICRKQIGLSLDQVRTKVKAIEAIEQGAKKPTFRQLDILEELYQVPRWVFISDTLPETYNYNAWPSFRLFKNQRGLANAIDTTSIRKLLIRIEHYRELVLDLRQDMEKPTPRFRKPKISSNPEKAASEVRKWLGLDKPCNFDDLRQLVEKKNIFVFVTSKLKGEARTNNKFRALCVHKNTLPIIIINDSDARKAQSSTIIHELGHLLKDKTYIDYWEPGGRNEQWCDRFANATLMPATAMREVNGMNSYDEAKRIARKMKVSVHAFLGRCNELGIINQTMYKKLRKHTESSLAATTTRTPTEIRRTHAKARTLTRERTRATRKVKKQPGLRADVAVAKREPGPGAIKAKKQFGIIVINTFFDAYQNGELGLLKVSNLLDLKKVEDVLDLEYV